MTIQETEAQIVSEFSQFDDWLDRYNFLIEMGKMLPVIDPRFKTDSHLISGCQSRVWLHARMEKDRMYFTADSDAVITRGIISLLIRVLDGKTTEEILQARLGFIDEIGLREHLSPTRANGLVSMIKQIKLYALAFQTKSGKGETDPAEE
ncbi:MAG: SufE family protein [Bacteroidales bacterium]|nr:SufE family protein [Lentimicrobiaceae bacterium]MDD5695091.1 SufE family protein [Bacteroidales bacterium]